MVPTSTALHYTHLDDSGTFLLLFSQAPCGLLPEELFVGQLVAQTPRPVAFDARLQDGGGVVPPRLHAQPK